MLDSFDLKSILIAVDTISSRQKKKKITLKRSEKLIPLKPNINDEIPPAVDKIIQEAEFFNFKILSKFNDTSTVDIKTKLHQKPYEEIRSQIIDGLYSQLSKKIKKNTLKTIFDLHIKIKDLEKQLHVFQIKEESILTKNNPILKNEITESSKKSISSITVLDKVLSKNKNFLKTEIVTSLKTQDSTITVLNDQIKNFKKTEEKLRLQLIDLEQDKILLANKATSLELNEPSSLNKPKSFKENIYLKSSAQDKSNMLRNLYDQVAKQKKQFLHLKDYSIKLFNAGKKLIEDKNFLKIQIENIEKEFLTSNNKVHRDFSFYKENYEKLIIENNDLKIRLSIAKKQIFNNEENKIELTSALNHLTNIFSETKIISNISPIKNPSSEEDLNNRKKIKSLNELTGQTEDLPKDPND